MKYESCRECGSSLAKRKVGRVMWGGQLHDYYKCRCGAGRRFPVKAAPTR